MKKILILIALAIQTQAQNVGIGNTSPTEKLDVTGNINVTGTIKANGLDGTAGQILHNNGNGTLSWSDASSNSLHLKYARSREYGGLYDNTPNSVSTYSYTVPPGVTKIWVEAWGGGSAATHLPATITNTTASKGGDAGGFLSAILTVVPSEVLTLYVGNGGSNVTGGGSSVFRNTPSIISILQVGGGSPFFNYYLEVDPITNISGFLKFVKGESGHVSTETYSQTSATNFVRTIVGGSGGSSYPNQKGGSGVTVTYNTSTNTFLSHLGITAGNGTIPGGGGGVGYGLISQGSGALGMIILHW
jgi:hypothetical protein